jgi:hypothetical protein
VRPRAVVGTAEFVNAVAAFLVLVSIVPIYLANRLSGGAALTQR